MTSPRSSHHRLSTRTLVVVGVLVSLFLAGVVSYYASSHPDGLMFVAGEKGFLASEKGHATSGSPFAGYATHGIGDAGLSGGIAGVVGVAVVGALAFGLFTVLRRRGHDQHGD
ncbi:cobalt ABC transporter permease [Phycicoccus sp. Root563]|uniref:PDGLE domain-containing protein n=1 Tax=Phycicoccus sp. Root563 TaxID=1736562 RepID=UPI0007031DCE|nr:PDGLE domain-containing protein [Phycicoccus sp. Root563]KQZ87696.1 cobalt ABC transporter permease [Phycicoccus sp. Root563]